MDGFFLQGKNPAFQVPRASFLGLSGNLSAGWHRDVTESLSVFLVGMEIMTVFAMSVGDWLERWLTR